MDSANQQIAIKDFMPAWKKHYEQEINRFRSEIKDGRIMEIPISRSLYIFNSSGSNRKDYSGFPCVRPAICYNSRNNIIE
jgi:hypothetical protein